MNEFAEINAMPAIKTAFGVLLLAALPFVSAVSSRSNTLQNTGEKEIESTGHAFEKAQSLIAAGELDKAIDLLNSIRSNPREDSLKNHLLGVAFYQKNDYRRAVEHLSIAARTAEPGSKQHRQAIQLLGLSHYSLANVKDAIPHLEQVVSWTPDNVEMVYALAISYIQTHNVEKSREALAKMFGLTPDSAPAYLINAQMMIRQRFEEHAEKELKTALELNPRLPHANYLLGELAIYKANIEQGISLLQKEIAINPASSMAYYRLGEAYTRQLKWDEAIPPLLKSISLNWDFSGPYIVLGKVYWKKGDLLKAEGALRTAVKMDPNNFSGHHLLAQVLREANRHEEAKKEFELAERLRTLADK